MHVTEPGSDHGHTLTEEKVAKAFEEMRGTKVRGEESDDEDDDVEIVSVLGRHNLLTLMQVTNDTSRTISPK